MGTKENPGKFDCYAAAKPDEPMFILLGRDPSAGALVRAWAMLRRMNGEDPAKVAEAEACAEALEAWATKLGKPLVQLVVPGAVAPAAVPPATIPDLSPSKPEKPVTEAQRAAVMAMYEPSDDPSGLLED